MRELGIKNNKVPCVVCDRQIILANTKKQGTISWLWLAGSEENGRSQKQSSGAHLSGKVPNRLPTRQLRGIFTLNFLSVFERFDRGAYNH